MSEANSGQGTWFKTHCAARRCGRALLRPPWSGRRSPLAADAPRGGSGGSGAARAGAVPSCWRAPPRQ